MRREGPAPPGLFWAPTRRSAGRPWAPGGGPGPYSPWPPRPPQSPQPAERPPRGKGTREGARPPRRCFGDTGVGVSTALLPAATRSQGAERQASAPQLCPSPGSPARGAFGQGASPEGRGPQGGRGVSWQLAGWGEARHPAEGRSAPPPRRTPGRCAVPRPSGRPGRGRRAAFCGWPPGAAEQWPWPPLHPPVAQPGPRPVDGGPRGLPSGVSDWRVPVQNRGRSTPTPTSLCTRHPSTTSR